MQKNIKPYGEMEDGLGAVLFHSETVQGDMLDPAALGEQQVCSRRQRVDVGSRGGTNGWRRSAVVNT